MTTACASYSPEAVRKNFEQHHGSQVGKNADDPSSYVTRYPQLLINSRSLPNGHIEKEYRWIRSCRYYYEIDPATNIIVGWRFEGSKQDCVTPP